MNIQEAKQARSGIDIEAIVTNKSETRYVNLKTGGQVAVCDATIEDNSGNMILTLWGDDVERVKIGSRVEIKNGYTNSFKGEISLTQGKFGELIVKNE